MDIIAKMIFGLNHGLLGLLGLHGWEGRKGKCQSGDWRSQGCPFVLVPILPICIIRVIRGSDHISPRRSLAPHTHAIAAINHIDAHLTKPVDEFFDIIGIDVVEVETDILVTHLFEHFRRHQRT